MFDDFLDDLGFDNTFADGQDDMNGAVEADYSDPYSLDHSQANPQGLYDAPVASEAFFDMDGDGVYDTVVSQYTLDMDGDFIGETLVTEYGVDVNGDGVIDAVQTDVSVHTDFDGQADYFVSELQVDTDGDGVADFFSTAEDYDGDGVYEAVTQTELTYELHDYSVAPVPGYTTYTPGDAEGVVGTPGESAEHWHEQEEPNSCAVASQEFVLEELTGNEYDEAELRDIAEANGWYTPEGGTPAYDTGNILEYMGMDVHKSTGGSIEDIENCLANGGEVIVGVDSDEIWYGVDDDYFGPGMDADHAIQVTGIDYSDPDNPMVIINDSGVPNGAGNAIPLDLFESAWEDGDNFMVQAYAPGTTN